MQLPESADEGHILPPSYIGRLPGIIGEVTYEMQVEVYRKGWRAHDTIVVPFLYLPRTAPSHPPIRHQFPEWGDWKLREYLEVDWETFQLSKGHGTMVEFCLPRPLSYKAQAQIPFVCSIGSVSFFDPDTVSQHLKVTLHKVTSLRSLGRTEVATLTLAQGDVLHTKIDKEAGKTKIFGMITGGRREGEMAWKVPNSIEVKVSSTHRMINMWQPANT
ncbi:hypothetical protein FRC03_011817 [Tulasnella sp. 419]|nr:hypothetical protein FRC03_011817 [Tulasnella sp. 419]